MRFSPVLAMALSMAFVPTHLYAQNPARSVTIVLPEALQTVEPCQSAVSTVGRVVKQNVTETLTELDFDTGTIKPRLATSWERLDDTTWRFKLREGVKFHDGAPFNADAVVYSINRTMDTALTCMVRNKFFGSTKFSFKVVDPYTLDITTDPAQPILPTVLTTMTITSPNTKLGEASRKPAGTGPYVMSTWDPGQKIVLDRFEGYWGDKPAVERATYVWRTESAVQAAMVATGEADIAPTIAIQDATNPATDFAYPNSETSRIRIGADQPPLNDVRVRKALNLAINREAFRGSILSKDVIPASQLVVPGTNGYNTDLKPWPYDLAEAKKLLAAAKADGVPVDKEIRLISRTNIFPNVTETMEALTQMWGEAGLNVKLQMLEVAQVLEARHQALCAGSPADLGDRPARQQYRRCLLHHPLQILVLGRPVGLQRSRPRPPDQGGHRLHQSEAARALPAGLRPHSRGRGAGCHAVPHGRLHQGQSAPDLPAEHLDQQRAATRPDQVQVVLSNHVVEVTRHPEVPPAQRASKDAEAEDGHRRLGHPSRLGFAEHLRMTLP